MGFANSNRRKHSKPGKTTLRAFHFRIEANNAQSQKLHQAITLAWELRNIQSQTLEDSRCKARQAKLRAEEPAHMSALDLKKMVASDRLPAKFRALHSQVRQEISARVSEGQKRWFEAMKGGRRHVRAPTTIARKHYRSITYPQYGTSAQVKSGVLHLSKLGDFRVLGWRKMRGAKKSVTIKFKEGHFWAIVMCEVQERDVCRSFAQAKACGLLDGGIDPGLSAVMNDSLGVSYETPKPLKKARLKLRRLQKNVSRKFEVRKKTHLENLAIARKAAAPGSPESRAPVAAGLVASLRTIPYSGRLRRSIKRLAKAHTKVERVRDDAAKKTARKIERQFARAAVEEHSLQFMVKNRRLAKATADVAIGKQKHAMRSALGAGRYFRAANTRPEGGNSQTCLCGAQAPKALKDRWHKCPDVACAIEMPRDQMAAIICQYETFGTLPTIKVKSAPGLGALERAAGLLKQRRGESKGKAGESQRAEKSKRGKAHGVDSLTSSKLSEKRSAPETYSMRPTAGGAQAPSAVAKTAGHVSATHTWPAEAKTSVTKKEFVSPTEEKVVSRYSPRSPLLQVGE